MRCFRPFQGILWGRWHCRAACVPRRAAVVGGAALTDDLVPFESQNFSLHFLTMGPDPVSASVFFTDIHDLCYKSPASQYFNQLLLSG